MTLCMSKTQTESFKFTNKSFKHINKKFQAYKQYVLSSQTVKF